MMKTPGAVLLLLMGLGLLLLLASAKADDIDQLELKYIRSQVQDFEKRLQTSEKKTRANENAVKILQSDVQQLKKPPKHVAFTAVLQPPSVYKWGLGEIGQYSYDMTLIHQKVLTNVGQAYSTNSGMFTAPVRGVYFFTFTTYCWLTDMDTGVKLMKNREEMLLVWERQDKGDNEDYATNSAVLSLEMYDEVYLQLPKNFKVHANMWSNIHTFSGFLLYAN
ncbi:cerebellin-3-like [Engraulis encrasicolus]|uniref:cerebellin-3-like n=1 Tax=Engraulis encrasicolus TaxID=184585 RepID=UPI002FD4ED14